MTVFGDIVITKLMEEIQIDWTIRDLKIERVSHNWKLTEKIHPAPQRTSDILYSTQLLLQYSSFNLSVLIHFTAWLSCILFSFVFYFLRISFTKSSEICSTCYEGPIKVTEPLVWWEVKFLLGHLSVCSREE